jgi:hypothetical protein
MNSENSIQERTPGSLHPAGSTASSFAKIIIGMFVVNAGINCLASNWPAAYNAIAVCWFVWVAEKTLELDRRYNAEVSERGPLTSELKPKRETRDSLH